MPTFDYQCGCGERFEAAVSTAGARTSCPACCSPRVRRLPPRVFVRGSSPPAPRIRTGDDTAPADGCGLLEPHDHAGGRARG